MLGVVLAAGRGKRLSPLTDNRSKAMLPIAGRPMIERVLEMLERAGVNEFVVVVHPDDCPLTALLTNDRWRDRVALAYQAQREGMAAALACSVPLIAGAGV
ncbi:MAG: NTP transferase domain-containing protein, partial [Anaerolineae bacterium]|nr:NTP transferase domain-containing protein [Anaerolineae bacterium]